MDTAASVGRDYLDERRSSWRAAFSAGAGGGALMAGATLLKFGVASLGLSAFYTGILSALNYVAVFCAAYLLHFTIATKLPAHTAATLAMSVQQPTGHRARLDAFLRIWRAMVRLQFAGLLGNVALAAPLAYLLDVVTVSLSGHHLLGDDKASHVLDAHSVLGPSLVYAALTGVFLWLSSLVGAVADNWVRVTRLVERLSTNVAVMRTVGPVRARPSAEWMAAHVGGITESVARAHARLGPCRVRHRAVARRDPTRDRQRQLICPRLRFRSRYSGAAGARRARSRRDWLHQRLRLVRDGAARRAEQQRSSCVRLGPGPGEDRGHALAPLQSPHSERIRLGNAARIRRRARGMKRDDPHPSFTAKRLV